MLLAALENDFRTEKAEPIDIPSSLWVEHLLPQGWREHWPLPVDGPDDIQRRDAHVHRLGNLTLVTEKLNQSMSNADWLTKKEALNQHAVLLMNSRVVAENPVRWDEATINARSRDLAERVIKLWPGPDTPFDDWSVLTRRWRSRRRERDSRRSIMGRPRRQQSKNGAPLGFEQTLWAAADKLRGHMDAAEYKHVVLGLIFLKYVSDAFEARQRRSRRRSRRAPILRIRTSTPPRCLLGAGGGALAFLQARAKQPEIGTLVDAAMDAIERENRSLQGVLPKDYARPALDKHRLGELIDLIGNIGFGEGDGAKDVLGRVYEYFLGQFAARRASAAASSTRRAPSSGSSSRCSSRTRAASTTRAAARAACSSSPRSSSQAHGGRLDDISIFGQESNPTTWRSRR